MAHTTVILGAGINTASTSLKNAAAVEDLKVRGV